MPSIDIAVAQATAVVGYDMIATNAVAKQIQLSNKVRRLKRVGLVGSAAFGDCVVAIYFGSEKIHVLQPTRFGANIAPKSKDQFWVSDQRPLLPGVPIKAIVEDQPASNQIILHLDIT